MYKKFVKRSLDIICAFAAILILWPIFLLVGLLVKIKLGTPIIFKQLRPGQNGKLFTMYKFRTMKELYDDDGNQLSDSERITTFGKALRRTSLDEIPEVINILKGDMSIIGPRPLLVKDYVFFSDSIKKRQEVKPGLSGLAQVNGRNKISWEKKFEYDLEYIKNISFRKDVKLLFQTVFKAFFMADDINKDGFVTDEAYGDYLLRTNKITKEEYYVGLANEKIIIANNMKGKK